MAFLPQLTILLHDNPDAVEKPAEPRVRGALVIDKLDLDRLHGGDGEYRLAYAGA